MCASFKTSIRKNSPIMQVRPWESSDAPLNGRIDTLRPGFEEEIVAPREGRRTEGTDSRVAPTPSINEQKSFWDAHWQQKTERKVLNDWTERRAAEILKLI